MKSLAAPLVVLAVASAFGCSANDATHRLDQGKQDTSGATPGSSSSASASSSSSSSPSGTPGPRDDGGAPSDADAGDAGTSESGFPAYDTCGWAPESHLTADLSCPDGKVISKIVFASWGDPIGLCGGFTYNPACNDPNTLAVAKAQCLGKQACSLMANSGAYGGSDPCPNVTKIIAAEATCGTVIDDSPVPPPPAAPPNHVCRAVNESHLSVDIACPAGQVVKSIAFANWGNATGPCGGFEAGSCNSTGAKAAVEALCLGRASCSVGANSNVLGGDPCPGMPKMAIVDAVCGP